MSNEYLDLLQSQGAAQPTEAEATRKRRQLADDLRAAVAQVRAQFEARFSA